MSDSDNTHGWLDRIFRFGLENRLIILMLTALIAVWGLLVAPFDWKVGSLPRDPVPVDAIPDIGENQQIVFTPWMGRSPQDIEDQVTYPLTVSLLGIPGVKTVRSFSMPGFSTVYVIFKDDVEFYWSRSRILEKLNSLPPGTLPEGVQPALGPDATALGQVFWYTLEGLAPDGRPAGGWDLDELRSIQDWQVRLALMSTEGIAEVASIGGFVREYQVDVMPDAMRAHGVTLDQVIAAVRNANLDTSARTIEVNRVEYMVRGIGFIKKPEDIGQAVVRMQDNVPIRVSDVAHVTMGPAMREGALDKGGAEAVGGVAVVRFGENPLAAIQRLKEQIAELAPSLPSRTIEDGTVSKVTVVPFYDRTGLIYETLGTLNRDLEQQVLISVLVVLLLVIQLRSSLLVSGLLPMAMLASFIAMKQFGIDANIVALMGISIAIGEIADMGIVMTESILKHLERAGPDANRKEVIFRAVQEVGGALMTSVSATLISFLPVFTLEAAEGKLFKPLAYTKTFAMGASVLLAIAILPAFAYLLLGKSYGPGSPARRKLAAMLAAGAVLGFLWRWWLGLILLGALAYALLEPRVSPRVGRMMHRAAVVLVVGAILVLFNREWMPLGAENGTLPNLVFVCVITLGLMGVLWVFIRSYERILRWALAHKALFLSVPATLTAFGFIIWLGAPRLLGWLPGPVLETRPMVTLFHSFPGTGKEFMPDFDEGSFLYMPTLMPHASMGEALEAVSMLDRAIESVPEVEMAVGKIGRAESPLDPAPVSMIETVVQYQDEYISDEAGYRLYFKFDRARNEFDRDDAGQLIPDPDGEPYRQWRPEIRSVDDLWNAIAEAAEIPGLTGAPKLQPIKNRIIMLQSGMRAPMGVKVQGPDLPSIEAAGLAIERELKLAPGVRPDTVIADRIIGKPYLEIHLDRVAIARYGLSVAEVQMVIETAIGGEPLTRTVEGRARYPVRVRYARELRDNLEEIRRILVPNMMGQQVPLEQLADIRIVRGPEMIRAEDTALTGYVLFDKVAGRSEAEVVEEARQYLQDRMDAGALQLPTGVRYRFAGTYENQIRAEKRMMLILPLTLFLIFLLIYMEFRNAALSLLLFSSVFVAWSGGFILLWLYGRPWFMDFSIMDVSMRALFQMREYNLSVAVWVGFISLFGMAASDGVLIATYLTQLFREGNPRTVAEIRETTVRAGKWRVRPAVMTTATTLLAFVPILASSGKGSEILVPMAIPGFGGMALAMITMFVVPVIYCWAQERLRKL